MPTYRNNSTSTYKLQVQSLFQQCLQCQKPPTTTKSKKNQNHDEQAWFKNDRMLWNKLFRENVCDLLFKETSTLPSAFDSDAFAP